VEPTFRQDCRVEEEHEQILSGLKQVQEQPPHITGRQLHAEILRIFPEHFVSAIKLTQVQQVLTQGDTYHSVRSLAAA